MEHLDVLVVGAGLSGIGAGALPADQVPVGHATRSSRPVTRSAARGTSSATPASGPTPTCSRSATRSVRGTARSRSPTAHSILQYIKDTAAESGIDEHIRFNHRIVRADWSTEDARWNITAERTDTGETVELTCGFVFSCSGYYRYDHGYQPDFAGMDRFEGTIVHPQAWPEDLDYAGKRVVVIGSGATAVTLIPSMAETAAHVTMLQRSPALHHDAAGEGSRSPTCCVGCSRRAGPGPPSAGSRRSPRRGCTN